MEIMDSFFGKNGTVKQLLDFNNSRQGMQSSSAMDRLQSLGKMVMQVLALLGQKGDTMVRRRKLRKIMRHARRKRVQSLRRRGGAHL